MLFLTRSESIQWSELRDEILRDKLEPFDLDSRVRQKLVPCFRCFAGAFLICKGQKDLGRRWIQAGVLEEEQGLFFNGFVNSFLERQNGRFAMAEKPFVDPRPFVHFAGVPTLKKSRQEFVRQAADSMPKFNHPIRIMDIGCGNGALVADFLKQLRDTDRVGDIGEILLVDPSPAMVDLAVKTVGEAFPKQIIRGVNRSFQDFSGTLDGHYDIALSAFAYHHMPYETKVFHLRKLAPWIDHFVLFELDCNNDLPELHSPELALAVYQCYGRVIDWVFSHDAPVDIAIAAVDCFLMAEAVSMLTMPRGERSDYHALRPQWHDMFRMSFGPEFTCLCDTTALAEDAMDLFTMHYGRA
ncbi:MAG TPA: class I SAM-dependent methyltransferase [bacterium]|nr:class I SAM-dependent methyltransferase [bacterium]HPO07222.1 class I SAM-dependent methyltransferase [bacterium]HQO33308.1 class I SAM-dependent methyltransferase [bacterium]